MHVREDGAGLGSSCSLILDPICCALAAHVACEVRSRKKYSRVALCAILTTMRQTYVTRARGGFTNSKTYTASGCRVMPDRACPRSEASCGQNMLLMLEMF